MELDCLESKEYKDFYGNKIPYIYKAMEKFYNKIKDIEENRYILEDRNPVEHIKYRVKNPESTKNKLKKNNFDISLESSMCNIQDVCGFRIICTFISDIKYIVNEIEKMNILKVVIKKDYINKPKKNGYRSYHMIVSVPVEIEGISEEIYIEIQIRTIAMDCWASLEHQLMYKKEITKKELFREELKKCADEMATTDLNLETIMTFIESEGM